MRTDALPGTRQIVRIVVIVMTVVGTVWIIYLVRRPIAWIFIAMFLAVALSGPVNLLSRKMKRGVAIGLVYLGLILIPIALAALIVPSVVQQANRFVNNVPGYVDDITKFVRENKSLNDLEKKYDITGTLEKQAATLPDQIGSAAGTVRDLGVSIVDSLFAGITILFLSIFMIAGGERWLEGILRLQDPERADRLRRTLSRIADAVGNYVAGAVVQGTIAGVATFIVLTILGVDFAGPLAVLVGLFDLLPLVGATIAALFVGLVTLFTDFPTATIVWAIWAIAYQQIENNIIQPQIQKKAVSIEPFFILVAVLFGSALFGVLGALLAVPVAAAIDISIREWWLYRQESSQGASLVLPDSAGDAPPDPPAGPGAPRGPAPA
jgi:predicted PurR-regulated permease PerM